MPTHSQPVESSAPVVPLVTVPPLAALETRRVTLSWSLGLLGAGVGLFGLMVASSLLEPPRWVSCAGFGLAAVWSALGALAGAFVFVRLWKAKPRPVGRLTFILAVPVLGGLFMTLLGALLALLATSNFARGRQLRSFGRIRLPPLRNDEERVGEAWAVDVPPEVRAALAAQWRENGRTEYASVAAFAQVTLRLMSLGAPSELIAAAQRDSLDEVRHAELCFSLARALDGSPIGPGAFPAARDSVSLSPLRSVALVQLAVESLVDGAFHEGLSARIIAKLVRRCEEPRIRAILKELAADEGRHAAHGWDVVEWCYREGGERVGAALRGAVSALPTKLSSDLPRPAHDGSWERFGIHGAGLEAEAFDRARTELVQRVAALTDSRPRLARAS